jgi:hypothetical protein
MTVDEHRIEAKSRPRPGSRLVGDELESIVVLLNSNFSEFSNSHVRDLVVEIYRRLAAGSRIQAHLIPLTMNRARAALEAERSARGVQ